MGIAAAIANKLPVVSLLTGKSNDKVEDSPKVDTPSAPDPNAIQEEEKKKAQQKAANRTKTVFTSPLGAFSDVNSEKKGLLG